MPCVIAIREQRQRRPVFEWPTGGDQSASSKYLNVASEHPPCPRMDQRADPRIRNTVAFKAWNLQQRPNRKTTIATHCCDPHSIVMPCPCVCCCGIHERHSGARCRWHMCKGIRSLEAVEMSCYRQLREQNQWPHEACRRTLVGDVPISQSRCSHLGQVRWHTYL